MRLPHFAGPRAGGRLPALAANRGLHGASSPAARYGVNVAALVLMVACLPATFASLPTQGHFHLARAERMRKSLLPRQARPRLNWGRRKADSSAGHEPLGVGSLRRRRRGDAAHLGWRTSRQLRPYVDLTRHRSTAAIYLFGVAIMLFRVSVRCGGHRLRQARTRRGRGLAGDHRLPAAASGCGRPRPSPGAGNAFSVPVVVGLAARCCPLHGERLVGWTNWRPC